MAMCANDKFRFLFSTLPTNDLGLLTRSVPIAEALSKEAHEVLFTSPGEAPSRLLKNAGFTNLKPRHPIYELSSGERNIRGLLKVLRSKTRMKHYGGKAKFLWQLLRALPLRYAPTVPEIRSMDHMAAIAGLMSSNFVKASCDAYLRMVEEYSPDAIVDFWNPFTCIAARKLKILLITVIQADAHPAAPGFIWWKETPAKVPTVVPAVNKTLRAYGLGEISKLEDLNLGDLTLVVGAAETDPLPNGVDARYIGPILWQKQDEVEPDWFGDLPKDKPVIWVYPGNPRYSGGRGAWDSEIVLKTCIEALANQEFAVVLSMGHQHLPPEYLPLPKNFIHVDYVPGLIMARRCNLMVHHGGYGSCQMGLLTGTPSVIVPTFSERESNARRVAEAGAGEFIVPSYGPKGERQIDVSEFSKKVARVLNDASYVKNAGRCSQALMRAGNVQKTVQLIEDFMAGK